MSSWTLDCCSPFYIFNSVSWALHVYFFVHFGECSFFPTFIIFIKHAFQCTADLSSLTWVHEWTSQMNYKKKNICGESETKSESNANITFVLACIQPIPVSTFLEQKLCEIKTFINLIKIWVSVYHNISKYIIQKPWNVLLRDTMCGISGHVF